MISKVKKSRNRYMNEVVDYYNRYYNRKLIARKLVKESKLVQDDSMLVLLNPKKISQEE